MHKIRTYNAISSKGLSRFSAEKYEVGSELSDPQGFILRSHKLHEEQVPESLLAVARAGAASIMSLLLIILIRVLLFLTPQAPMPTQ